jgi:hypothetical protein
MRALNKSKSAPHLGWTGVLFVVNADTHTSCLEGRCEQRMRACVAIAAAVAAACLALCASSAVMHQHILDKLRLELRMYKMRHENSKAVNLAAGPDR